MSVAPPVATPLPDAEATRHVDAIMPAIIWLLRAEGIVALAASVIAYHALGGGWWVFAALFLVPDLSMLGYLGSTRVGARCYNTAHTYLAPALLALAGTSVGTGILLSIALIWAAHIGFDRAMGYGLKYPEAFGATHLGWKGKVRTLSPNSIR